MKLSAQLQEAVFLERLSRFAALVKVEGQEVLAHVANSGRMRELLYPGVRLLLTPASAPHRKTAYDLALVDLGHTLVSADARLPNYLVQEVIADSTLAAFKDYHSIKKEVVYGDSRLDLLLEGEGSPCFVEVKSVTLVEDGVGLFPDAPTERGRRHVQTLVQAHLQGYRCAVVFVVQREDVVAFAPYDTADPAFSMALRQAGDSGVEAFAFKCSVTTDEIRITDEVPVRL